MSSYEQGLVEGLTVGSTLGESEHKHCINCDEKIPKNAEFCPRCGARQPPTEW